MPQDPNAPDSAQEIFSEYLSRRIAGEPVDWEQFRAAHVQYAARLETLYRDYCRGQALLARGPSTGHSAGGSAVALEPAGHGDHRGRGPVLARAGIGAALA